MDDWISIEDGLPDSTQTVLVWGRIHKEHVNDVDFGVYALGQWWRGNPIGIAMFVTHWMPRPLPPGASP